jgi:hypothetical protein
MAEAGELAGQHLHTNCRTGAANRLDAVDWNMVYQRYWRDEVADMDQQRRKQAEFLIHQFCPWTLVQEIGVAKAAMKARVEEIVSGFAPAMRPVVNVRADWYCYADYSPSSSAPPAAWTNSG